MRRRLLPKHLQPRFLPFHALAIAVLVLAQPSAGGLLLGSVLVLAGALVRAWGAGHLVKNERLTVSGPYAYVRHPLYAGTLLAGVGFSLMAGGWLSLALLAGLFAWFFLDYFPRKERRESERLERMYDGAYARYRERVPALVPSLRRWRPPPDARAMVNPELRWSGACYAENHELGTALGLGAVTLAFVLRAALGS